MTTLNKKFTTR